MAEISDFPNNSDTHNRAVNYAKTMEHINSEKSDAASTQQQTGAKKGSGHLRKRSAGKRLAQQFIEEDLPAVKDWLIDEVILPGVKNLTWDIFAGGLSRFFWGSDNPPSTPYGYSRGYQGSYRRVNYSTSNTRAHQEAVNAYSGSRREQISAQNTADDLVFDTQWEAEAVLKDLLDIYYEYGAVRLADLYDHDLVNLGGAEFTDNKFGWAKGINGLENARVVRIREGWTIKFPRIAPIS